MLSTFIRRHWVALLAALPMLPNVWKGAVSLFDWGARVDLAAAKLHEAGGVSAALAFLLSPPPWLIWPAIAIALVLLIWDRRRNVSPAVETPPKRSDLDGTIKLECLTEIFRFPPDGKMRELIVHSVSDQPASFVNTWMSEYAYRERPDAIPTRAGMIDKCRITNFGAAPVFNLKLTAKIAFSEHIKLDAIRTEQRSVGTKTFEFSLPQIDPGAASATEFLAWNKSGFHAAVAFANEVELQSLGSTERETVRLIPAYAVLSLWPPEPPPAPPSVQQKPPPRSAEIKFTDRTPRELLALYEGRTPLQAEGAMAPYKGQWINGEGLILNLLPDGRPNHSVAVLKDGPATIECRFGPNWSDALSRLNKGEKLRFRGKISDNQNGSQLYLLDCELVS